MPQYENMDLEKLKQLAAIKALNFVSNGMRLGIGTGSTVGYFIQALKEKVEKEKWTLYAAYSSEKSKYLSASKRIISIDNSLDSPLDLYVDGADEIDEFFHMIKGGGKALLREKIVATASGKNMIVIVDESKLSKKLGRHPLPVEIIPFGYKSTIQRIEKEGLSGKLRLNDKNEPDLTDNGNYLFDLTFHSPIENPKSLHFLLKQILGVVETGVFFDLAKIVLVGRKDGSVQIYE